MCRHGSSENKACLSKQQAWAQSYTQNQWRSISCIMPDYCNTNVAVALEPSTLQGLRAMRALRAMGKSERITWTGHGELGWVRELWQWRRPAQCPLQDAQVLQGLVHTLPPSSIVGSGLKVKLVAPQLTRRCQDPLHSCCHTAMTNGYFYQNLWKSQKNNTCYLLSINYQSWAVWAISLTVRSLIWSEQQLGCKDWIIFVRGNGTVEIITSQINFKSLIK